MYIRIDYPYYKIYERLNSWKYYIWIKSRLYMDMDQYFLYHLISVCSRWKNLFFVRVIPFQYAWVEFNAANIASNASISQASAIYIIRYHPISSDVIRPSALFDCKERNIKLFQLRASTAVFTADKNCQKWFQLRMTV